MKKKDIEIEKILKPYNDDIKRHIKALSEDFQGKVQAVAEQFNGLNVKLDSHTEMMGKMSEDITIIKDNVEFLKGGLKKKVDYDEFMALEKRMTIVEAKVRR